MCSKHPLRPSLCAVERMIPTMPAYSCHLPLSIQLPSLPTSLQLMSDGLFGSGHSQDRVPGFWAYIPVIPPLPERWPWLNKVDDSAVARFISRSGRKIILDERYILNQYASKSPLQRPARYRLDGFVETHTEAIALLKLHAHVIYHSHSNSILKLS